MNVPTGQAGVTIGDYARHKISGGVYYLAFRNVSVSSGGYILPSRYVLALCPLKGDSDYHFEWHRQRKHIHGMALFWWPIEGDHAGQRLRSWHAGNTNRHIDRPLTQKAPHASSRVGLFVTVSLAARHETFALMQTLGRRLIVLGDALRDDR